MSLFSPIKPHERDLILKMESPDIPYRSFWSDLFHNLRRNPLALIAFFALLAVVILALFGPLFAPASYYQVELPIKNQSPSLHHWFGTDELGRDLFARCCIGARISLFIGLAATLIDLVLGVFYGSVSGYLGGKVDTCMMRFVDILHSIPHFLLVILLIVVAGPGLFTMIIALAMTGWLNMARIVRGQILQIKERDFVKAAKGFGASPWRILSKHLLPNSIGPIIVTVTFTVPLAIFGEAFLSFLGLGVQSPLASWGTLANDGLASLRFYPWRLFIPAALICLTMLCINIIGDALREALDPKLTR
jgi:oligopeptide transport system permease protein